MKRYNTPRNANDDDDGCVELFYNDVFQEKKRKRMPMMMMKGSPFAVECDANEDH